jgi:hypothetical protein
MISTGFRMRAFIALDALDSVRPIDAPRFGDVGLLSQGETHVTRMDPRH